MKHNSFYIIIFLLCINCRVGRTHGIEYDCRLYEGDFNELEYVSKTSIEDSFTDFIQSVDNGVFFINRFLGQQGKFYKAILLKEQSEGLVIIDLLKNKRRITLPNESQTRIKEILSKVEKGYFRQACFKGSSESSLSVLVVKVNGSIVMKYEAIHHDYSYLNEDEKIKIKNSLQLIKLMTDSVN